jgi:predicted transcriptional regulator
MTVGYQRKNHPDAGVKSTGMIEPIIGTRDPQGGDANLEEYSSENEVEKKITKQISQTAAAAMLREEKIVRLLSEGATISEIAGILGVTTGRISSYVRRPRLLKRLYDFNKEAFDNLQEEYKANKEAIMERLEQASMLALEELIELATGSKSDVIRYKASQDILDRNPHVSRTKRLEGGAVNNTFMNSQVLMQMAAVAREISQQAGAQVESDGGRNEVAKRVSCETTSHEGVAHGHEVPLNNPLASNTPLEAEVSKSGGQVEKVEAGNGVAILSTGLNQATEKDD